MLNSKTFKHHIHFQGLSRALKNGKKFSRTFWDFQDRVAIVLSHHGFILVSKRVELIDTGKESSSTACMHLTPLFLKHQLGMQ